MRYKAFISYKHSEYSRAHAIALEKALKNYAKPLLRPPVKIFRDEKHMVPSSSLSKLIRDGLEESEYLLFLAEEEAANSPWCRDELEYWCKDLGRTDKLIPVHINDRIALDKAKDAIDWGNTNALPDLLEPCLPRIPLYVDLTWAKRESDRDLHNPRYQGIINMLTAKFRGVTPEQINDEEIRVYRRNLRLRNGAIITLSVLLILAVSAFIYANSRNQFAISKQKEAQDSALVAQEQREVARDSARSANEQRRVATIQRDSARLERNQAILARAEEARQRKIAADSARSAQVQRGIARDSARSAREQRDTAEQQRERAEEALDQAQSNFLQAQSLLSLYKNDPTKAMKIAEYLYRREPTSISIPMINSFYDDFIFIDNQTFASPFYELIDYGQSGHINRASFFEGGLLAGESDTEQELFLATFQRGGAFKHPNPSGPVQSISISGDGSLLLFAGETSVTVLNNQGNRVATIRDAASRGFTGAFFVPGPGDTEEILTAEKGGTLKWWSVEGDPIRRDPSNTGNIFRAAASPDGQFLATGSRSNRLAIRKLNAGSGSFEPYGTLLLDGALQSLQFFSDSDSILISTDKTASVYRLTDKSSRVILDIKWRQLIHQASLSSDQHFVLVAFSDGPLGIYNLRTRASVATLKGSAYPLEAAWFEEQTYQVRALGQDGTLRAWNLKGKLVELVTNPGPDFEMEIYRSAESSDGQWAAAHAGNQATLRHSSGRTVQLTGHLGRVTDVNFAPHDSLLITSAEDRTTRVWDLQGNLLHTFRTDVIVEKAFFTKDNSTVLLNPAPDTYFAYPIKPSVLIEIARQAHIPDLSPKEKEQLRLK